MKRIVIVLSGLSLLCTGCPPDPKKACYKNEECIEGYLCNKDNRCIEVDQEKIEILVETLDDAVVGNKYSYTLSAKGGLEPHTWSVETGPNGLTAVENTQTHAWSLSGTPTSYQADPVEVRLRLADNSIDEQSTTKDLSIKILYCSTESPGVVCSVSGTCNAENKCECNEAYAGNQCELCDTESGYERDDQQMCVRYQYQCESDACGADIQRRSCVGTLCSDWTTITECIENQVCSVTTEMHECSTCDHGCNSTTGLCNQCNPSDPCCAEDGNIIPLSESHVCELESETICEDGSACGSDIVYREHTKTCDGTSSLCSAAWGDWSESSVKTCEQNEYCSIAEGDPVCSTCPNGCSPLLSGKLICANRVFITSTDYYSTSIANSDNSDALCQSRAQAGGLSGNYVAWLSDDSISARSKLESARGWVRIDGLPFADSIDDLADGEVFYPIVIDEFGNFQRAYSWTGTNSDGTAHEENCKNWQSTGLNDIGMSGEAHTSSILWTQWGSVCCSSKYHLYCFGTDLNTPVEPTRVDGRYAFIALSWTPGSGIEDADSFCQGQAFEANLPGEYRAFLGTIGGSATSRFEATGDTWVRVDNIPIVREAADLFLDQPFLTGIHLRADGSGDAYGGVWVGADDHITEGTEETTCSNWLLDSGGSGNSGYGGEIYIEGNFSTECDSKRKLFCFQQ